MVLVLFNIGWMKYYKGQTQSDRIVNGGRYIDINATGYEVKNFQAVGNYLYGYVKPPGLTIDVGKLGAPRNVPYADHVTIVFTATRPEGGNVVVGWYRDARVWRCEQRINGRSYYARTSKDNYTLLEVDERVFPLPRRASGSNIEWAFGRSNIRYIYKRDKRIEFIRQLRAYLENPTEFNDFPKQSGHRRQTINPDKRAKVEKAAIEHVINYFSNKGYFANLLSKITKAGILKSLVVRCINLLKSRDVPVISPELN